MRQFCKHNVTEFHPDVAADANSSRNNMNSMSSTNSPTSSSHSGEHCSKPTCTIMQTEHYESELSKSDTVVKIPSKIILLKLCVEGKSNSEPGHQTKDSHVRLVRKWQPRKEFLAELWAVTTLQGASEMMDFVSFLCQKNTTVAGIILLQGRRTYKHSMQRTTVLRDANCTRNLINLVGLQMSQSGQLQQMKCVSVTSRT